MAEEFSLQELILGYCRQLGALVEPPAYGVYEVLLPDEVAARWNVEALQRFVFPGDELSAAVMEDEPLNYLNYGHPLVEVVVDELRQKIANGVFFVADLRLEKPGLFGTIEKALAFSNAKMFQAPRAVERRVIYHYIRFNFKASLIADEKHELILPIWMHLQGGYAVRPDDLERLARLETESSFKNLVEAAPAWTSGKPLAPEVITALLERSHQAALVELSPDLEGLHRRLQRYLELDRARLQQYYDDLEKDAEKRLQKAEVERRPSLEAKLTAIADERQAKLADIEQKYHLRVELELINLAVIAQPKLELTIEIEKRGVSIQRQAVWDPLLHQVEPLTCDVCGQPGDNLALDENGHLAHLGCLAAQCVECKRVYCQHCSNQIQACVVCDRPVCIHSLVSCPTCGRVTCHAHINLCHAESGEPRRLKVEEKLQEARPAPTIEMAPPKTEPPVDRQAPRKKETPKKPLLKQKNRPRQKSEGPKGDYMEVYSDPAEGVISAYVIVKKRELAERTWEMTDDGIAVHCRCEKLWACPQNDIVYRPAPENQLEAQMMSYIYALREEYNVPVKKIHFYHVRQGEAHDERRLKIPTGWKDPHVLEAARQGFDRLSAKRLRR
jgi:hypothetical protein